MMKVVFNAMVIVGAAIVALFLVYMVALIHVEVIRAAMLGERHGLVGLAVFGTLDLLTIGLIGSVWMES